MKYNISYLGLAVILAVALLANSSCQKSILEPSMEGTWTEIESDSVSKEKPTGCTLVIDQAAGDVSLCGFPMVQPKNVTAIFVKNEAKLFIKNGQMYYRQRNTDLLYLFSMTKSDLYFIDYDFEGKYLWIIGDNTSARKSAKGAGRVFVKK